MFPGNKNKKLLIKKLVDVKTDIKDDDYDNQESYLGNTIEEDYNTNDDKPSSFVLTKINNLTKPKTETQKKLWILNVIRLIFSQKVLTINIRLTLYYKMIMKI